MTGRTSDLPKLHVCDIPKELEDLELKNLFNIYGKVTEVYINASGKRNTNWAFITFSSFEDAEKAIENPPNGLKVKYSSATLEFMEKQKNSENSREASGLKSSMIKPLLTNGMQKLSLEQSMSSGDDESCKVCGKDIVDLCTCCQEYYCSLRCANVIRRHKLFCIPEQDDDNRSVASTLNSVRTKQRSDVLSQQDNSRSIDLRHMRNQSEKTDRPMSIFKGRDSSSDEDQSIVISNSKPKRQNDVSSPQENARSIDLRHMRNRHEKTDRPETMVKGQKSYSDDDRSSVISMSKRQSDISCSSKQEKPNQKRSLDSHLRRKQSDVHNEERQTFKGHFEDIRRKQKDLCDENRQSFEGRDSYSEYDTDSKSSKKTPPKRTKLQNNEKSPKIQKEPEHSDGEYIPPKSNCPLPLDEYSKVTISWKDENSTYAFLTERLPDMMAVNTKLNRIDLPLLPISELKINSKCAAKFDEEFYRAKIIKVMQMKALVEFVDFGNFEEVSFRDIKKLPDELASTKRLAFPIEFHDGTHVEAEDILDVIPVGMQNNIVYVEAKKEDKECNSDLEDSKTLKVRITYVNEDGTYWVTTPQKFSETLDLSDVIENSRPLKVLMPKINQIYAALVGVQWFRVKVTDISPLTIFFIDTGMTDEAPEVFKLAEKFKYLPPKASKIKIIKGNGDYRVMNELLITVIRKERDLQIVEAKKEKPESIFLRRKKENGKYVEIASETLVSISSFESTRTVFVQANNKEHVDFLNSIIEECKNAPFLKEEPSCGEIVAVPWDQLYYRGEVLSKDGEKFKILFVDFGNVGTVKFCEMKILPDSFKNAPYCAVEVGLAGLPKSEFNAPASELMNLLATESKVLKIVYDNDLRNVHLFNKESLNEKLEQLMKRSWRRKGLNPKIFEYHDLIFDQIETGEEVVISTAKILSQNNYLGLASTDNQHNEVNAKLAEYIDDGITLIPEINEVCLATNENKWYRAVCLKNESEKSELFFIDHGHIDMIPHADIRPIPYQLMIDTSNFKKFEFYGLDEIPRDVRHLIENEYQREKFMATIVQDYGEIATVFVPEINKILIQNNIPEIIMPDF